MHDVLGYPRTLRIDPETDSGYLTVLPFHTGPLGLLPGTEAHISLTEGADGCEILIRPYKTEPDNILQLECTMADEKGVLLRLVAAISDLNINIVNKVSTATDLNLRHRVSMLLDWSTSHHKQPIESSPAQIKYYHQYHSVFPVGIKRCVELFESIVEHCGDVLVTQTTDGVDMPMMSMRELSPTAQVIGGGIVTVKTYSQKYQVRIDLPNGLLAMLRQNLQVGPVDPLLYIPLAEPDTKTLRVFFPRPVDVPKIIHVAFFHLNIPHAYETILLCLREAEFNVLTSLVRRHTQDENVVEAVLECNSEPPVPARSKVAAEGEDLCAWLASLMVEKMSQKDADLFRLCKLRLGLPLHPKPASPNTISLSAVVDRPTTPSVPGQPLFSEDCPLITFVRRGKEITSRPSLYISYSPNAALYASLLKRKIEDTYRVTESKPSEDTDGRSHRAIDSCDYFVGIWLPELSQGGTADPWLGIELWVAVNQMKRAIILYLEGMDVRFLSRLGPLVLPLPFSHGSYETQTLELIRDKYCLEHFVDRVTEASAAGGLRNRGPSVLRPELTNRAAFARTFIQKNPNGITARDLYEAFQKEGIRIQRTYISSLLGRLQANNLIVWNREDKRYYPSGIS